MAYPRKRRRVVVPPLDPTQPPTVLWRCLTCGKAKPESEFTMSNYRSGHFRARCRPCEAERLRVSNKASRERQARVSIPGSTRVPDVHLTIAVGVGRRRHGVLPDFNSRSLSQLAGGA